MSSNWIFQISLIMLTVLSSHSAENETEKEMINNNYMYNIYALVLSILLLFLNSYYLQRNMYNAKRIFYSSQNPLKNDQISSIPYIVQRNSKKFFCTILFALYIIVLYASVWFSLLDNGTSLTLVIWLALLTKSLNELVLSFTTEISINIQFILSITFYIVMLIGFFALSFFWMLNGILTMILGISVFASRNYITWERPRNTFRPMNGGDFSDLHLHEMNEIDNVRIAAVLNEPEENVMNDVELVEKDSQVNLKEENESMNDSQKVEIREGNEMHVDACVENEFLLTNIQAFMDKYFKIESNVEKNEYLKDDPVGKFNSENHKFIKARKCENSESKNRCSELINCRSSCELKTIGTVRDDTKEQVVEAMETPLVTLSEMDFEEFVAYINKVNMHDIIEEEERSDIYEFEKTAADLFLHCHTILDEYNLNIDTHTDIKKSTLVSSSVIGNQGVVGHNKCRSHSEEFETSNSVDNSIKAYTRIAPHPIDYSSPENCFKMAAKEQDRVTTTSREKLNKLAEKIPFTRKKIAEYTKELESIVTDKNNALNLSDYQSPVITRNKNLKLEAKILKILSNSSSSLDTDFDTNAECEFKESSCDKLEGHDTIKNLKQIYDLYNKKCSIEIPIMDLSISQLKCLNSFLEESLDPSNEHVFSNRNEEKLKFEMQKCEETNSNSVMNFLKDLYDNETSIELSGDVSKILDFGIEPISKFEEADHVHISGNSDLSYTVKECNNRVKSSANIPLPEYNTNIQKKELKALAASVSRAIDEFANISFAEEDMQDTEYSETSSSKSSESSKTNTVDISKKQCFVHNSGILDADILKTSFDSGLKKFVQKSEALLIVKDLSDIYSDQKDSESYEKIHETSADAKVGIIETCSKPSNQSVLSVVSTWVNELSSQSFSGSNNNDPEVLLNTEIPCLNNRDKEFGAQREQTHGTQSGNDSLEERCELVSESLSLKQSLSELSLKETVRGASIHCSTNADSVYKEFCEERSWISDEQGANFLSESMGLQDVKCLSTHAEGMKTEIKGQQKEYVLESAEYPNTESSEHTSTEGAVNIIDLFFIYNVPNARK